MAHIAVPGRLGQDATIKNIEGNSGGGKANTVTKFSVAEDVWIGRLKQTQWYECSLWGVRGEKLVDHLTKGKQVTVFGNFKTRDYNGKTYLDIDVSDVALQGGGEQRRRQEGNNGHNDGTTADELDDELPF